MLGCVTVPGAACFLAAGTASAWKGFIHTRGETDKLGAREGALSTEDGFQPGKHYSLCWQSGKQSSAVERGAFVPGWRNALGIQDAAGPLHQQKRPARLRNKEGRGKSCCCQAQLTDGQEKSSCMSPLLPDYQPFLLSLRQPARLEARSFPSWSGWRWLLITTKTSASETALETASPFFPPFIFREDRFKGYHQEVFHRWQCCGVGGCCVYSPLKLERLWARGTGCQHDPPVLYSSFLSVPHVSTQVPSHSLVAPRHRSNPTLAAFVMELLLAAKTKANLHAPPSTYTNALSFISSGQVMQTPGLL